MRREWRINRFEFVTKVFIEGVGEAVGWVLEVVSRWEFPVVKQRMRGEESAIGERFGKM